MNRYRVVYTYLDGFMGSCYVHAANWLDAQRVAYVEIAKRERIRIEQITILSAKEAV